MDEYPALDELIWLFECAPIIEFEDLGWPTSKATFETRRGPWTVSVDIEPYEYSVAIRLSQDGLEVVHLSMQEAVATVKVDRTHGTESMVVGFDRNSRLNALCLTLKPSVSVAFDTARPWES